MFVYIADSITDTIQKFTEVLLVKQRNNRHWFTESVCKNSVEVRTSLKRYRQAATSKNKSKNSIQRNNCQKPIKFSKKTFKPRNQTKHLRLSLKDDDLDMITDENSIVHMFSLYSIVQIHFTGSRPF